MNITWLRRAQESTEEGVIKTKWLLKLITVECAIKKTINKLKCIYSDMYSDNLLAVYYNYLAGGYFCDNAYCHLVNSIKP